jgi:predicted transposase/invertase (TIGR01784 family)
VDVRCTDSTGRQFIVEMQMHWTESFKSRVLFNASKAYVRQLERKKDYKLLQPVYALSFVNEVFDADPSVCYHDYKIVNIEHTEKRIEGLEFVFIELPKFRPDNRAEKKLYDLWLTFLTQVDEDMERIPPDLLQEELTKEALQYLESSSYTKEQLQLYDRYWDSVRTQRTYIVDALDEGLQKGEAIGLEKGRTEGEAIGLEKGEAIGLEKGRAEALREIALNALRSGHSMAQVQALTGLSEEEIKKISE